MIEIGKLYKHYGNKEILNDINITLNSGEIIGLLGLNGAGKTTLINHICGLIKPQKGNIYINNKNIVDNLINSKQIMGVVPEIQTYYKFLNPIQHLEFVYDIYSCDKNKKIDQMEKMLDLFNLFDFQNVPLKKCSKGTIQKTMLAMALIHNPEILILDEPFSGLDIPMIKKIKEYLKKLKENNKLILLSTHIAEIAEGLCKKIAFLHNKHIVEYDYLSNLETKYKINKVENIFIKICGES